MTETGATSSADAARDRRRHVRVALALAAVTFLVFVQTVRHDFVNFDDHDYVLRNPRTLQGVTLDNVRWAFTTLKLLNWHPLTWLSHMADVSLFGLWPGGHHLTSVAFHAANAGLLYLVLRGLTGSAGRSLAVAALFAVHPLRMESVAWVSERKDVLSGLFFILTLGAYTRYVRSRSLAWYGLTLATFALGLMAKPMLVTLPCVLILLDIWPLARLRDGATTLRRVVLEKMPMFAMAAAVSIVTYIAQRTGGAVGEERQYPLTLRLANAAWACGRYLKKTLWPSDLAVFYPYPGSGPDHAFPWGQAAASGVVILLITLACAALWRRERAAMIGWLWFVGTLVPTVGIVQVGGQSMADRYTYIPHIGLFVAIVWTAVELFPRGRPAARAEVWLRRLGVATVIACAATTVWQLRYWRDSATLFTRAIEVTENNARAHALLALSSTQRGRQDEARVQYRAALAIEPHNPEANNNYGLMLLDVGQTDEAFAHIERAVRAQPRYAEAHNNLANLLFARGEVPAALRHHEAAVRLDPDSPRAHYNFGVTLATLGRLREAQARFERSLQLKPDNPDARYAYGLVMAGLGYEVAAVGQLREANFLKPDWFDALRSLAWLQATSPDPKARDGTQAVIVAERACQLTAYANPVALDTLAAAYAEAGRFDSAASAAARAEQLAREANQSELSVRFAARLALYRDHKAFHRQAGATTQPFNP